jgi:hypothetical protein
MKKQTCSNCDNYCIRSLDLVPMYHCTEVEYGSNPEAEKFSKVDGVGCPLWMEKAKFFAGNRSRRGY